MTHAVERPLQPTTRFGSIAAMPRARRGGSARWRAMPCSSSSPRLAAPLLLDGRLRPEEQQRNLRSPTPVVAEPSPMAELRRHDRLALLPLSAPAWQQRVLRRRGDDRYGSLLCSRRLRLRPVAVSRARHPFGITLATLMIPPIVTFIPTYVLFAKLGVDRSVCTIDPAYLFRQRLLHLHDAPVLPRHPTRSL